MPRSWKQQQESRRIANDIFKRATQGDYFDFIIAEEIIAMNLDAARGEMKRLWEEDRVTFQGMWDQVNAENDQLRQIIGKHFDTTVEESLRIFRKENTNA